MKHKLLIFFLPFMVVVTIGHAQSPLPPLISPEVHPDGSVTFRLRAPNAQQVSLEREGTKAVPMQKDEQGVWSVTTVRWSPIFTATRSRPTALP